MADVVINAVEQCARMDVFRGGGGGGGMCICAHINVFCVYATMSCDTAEWQWDPSVPATNENVQGTESSLKLHTVNTNHE